MNHPFEQLLPEYKALLSTMRVLRPQQVDVAARKIQALVPTIYAPEQEATHVPAVLVGALDYREDDNNLRCGLGQGDPYNRISTHVPRNKGPFSSKSEADIFYIRYDHLDDNSAPWSWPYACWKGEAWNGFGPRNHGIHTGYLWGGTNHYVKGKYVADGVWDPNYVDTQLGIIPVMMRLVALDPSLAFDTGVNLDHTAAPPPVPQPVPVGVGGGSLDTPDTANMHDTVWLQNALNRAFLMPDEQLQVDGNYGRRTREAVRAFQRFNKLDADGLFGPKTDAALTATLASRAGPGGRQ